MARALPLQAVTAALAPQRATVRGRRQARQVAARARLPVGRRLAAAGLSAWRRLPGRRPRTSRRWAAGNGPVRELTRVAGRAALPALWKQPLAVGRRRWTALAAADVLLAATAPAAAVARA